MYIYLIKKLFFTIIDKKIEDVVFENFKVFYKNGMKIKITDGKNYFINILK